MMEGEEVPSSPAAPPVDLVGMGLLTETADLLSFGDDNQKVGDVGGDRTLVKNEQQPDKEQDAQPEQSVKQKPGGVVLAGGINGSGVGTFEASEACNSSSNVGCGSFTNSDESPTSFKLDGDSEAAEDTAASSLALSRTQFSLELDRVPVTHPSRAQLLEQSPILGQARELATNDSEDSLFKGSETLLAQTQTLIFENSSAAASSAEAGAGCVSTATQLTLAPSSLQRTNDNSTIFNAELMQGNDSQALDSTSNLLAETALLVGKPSGSVNEKHERPSSSSASSDAAAIPSPLSNGLDVQAELSKVITCDVKELLLIVCGQRVNLQDIFLLDTCVWLPIREDIANDKVLASCSEALALNGYDVRSNEEGQLRAGFHPLPIDSSQLQQQQQPVQTNPFAPGFGTSGTPKQKTLAWAQEKGESTKAIFNTAMSFSLNKLSFAIGRVNSSLDLNLPQPKALPDATEANSNAANKAGFSESALSDQNYCSVAIGVDARTKQRLLAISGLEKFAEQVLEHLVLCNITSIGTSNADEQPSLPLDEDYVRDLECAFQLATELELMREMAPAEKTQRMLEWRAAELITLVKVCYKQYGVPFPDLERPPVVSQLALEYDDDDDESNKNNEEKNRTIDTSNMNAKQFKMELSRLWTREYRARKRRKEKQLDLRHAICGRNRRAIINRLNASAVARGSKEVLLLADEMKLAPKVVLGYVSAFYQRKPGRLSVTATHLLFHSNILGLKTSGSWALADITKCGKAELKGAASFVGDAAFVVTLTPGSDTAAKALILQQNLQRRYQRGDDIDGSLEVSFIIATLLEVKKIIELVKQVLEMGQEQLQPAVNQEQSNNHKDQQHQQQQQETGEDKVELAQKKEEERVANMKKLLASTILNDDEEEF